MPRRKQPRRQAKAESAAAPRTQGQLAKAIGYSKQNISNWIKAGWFPPKRNGAWDVAEVLEAVNQHAGKNLVGATDPGISYQEERAKLMRYKALREKQQYERDQRTLLSQDEVRNEIVACVLTAKSVAYGQINSVATRLHAKTGMDISVIQDMLKEWLGSFLSELSNGEWVSAKCPHCKKTINP